jgi:hypothetical protein
MLATIYVWHVAGSHILDVLLALKNNFLALCHVLTLNTASIPNVCITLAFGVLSCCMLRLFCFGKLCLLRPSLQCMPKFCNNLTHIKLLNPESQNRMSDKCHKILMTDVVHVFGACITLICRISIKSIACT